MSKYEVMWGDCTEYIESGNQISACIEMIDRVMNDCGNDIIIKPFLVTNLVSGEQEAIGLATVLNIRNMAGEYDPNLPEPPLLEDCELAKASIGK
jgi:hypothetical protein